jgi:hypothetical protein
MKNCIIAIALTIMVIIGLSGLIGLSYNSGWIGVDQTKTIYKDKENAKREVFEQTQMQMKVKNKDIKALFLRTSPTLMKINT